jgi:hypothetical protein
MVIYDHNMLMVKATGRISFFPFLVKANIESTHDRQKSSAVAEIFGEFESRRKFVGLATDESDRRNRNSDGVNSETRLIKILSGIAY